MFKNYCRRRSLKKIMGAKYSFKVRAFLKIYTLSSALWLVVDMVLDGRQTLKYQEFSPYFNLDHEANRNISDRIMIFCNKSKEMQFDRSKLTNPERNLHDGWTKRCRTNNFKFFHVCPVHSWYKTG